MPTHSTILDHPERAAIEFALAKGIPIRQIAKKHNVSIHVLYRYRDQIPPQLRAAHLGARLKAGADLEKLRIDESEGILQNLALQRARLLLVQDAALESGDRREVAYISDVIHRNVKLTGVYLGEFAKHQVQTSVSVLIMPQYLDMRAALLRALTPFPAARKAVATALHDLEAQAAATPPAKAELPPPPVIDSVAEEVSANA
jgi:transposase-like protein